MIAHMRAEHFTRGYLISVVYRALHRASEPLSDARRRGFRSEKQTRRDRDTDRQDATQQTHNVNIHKRTWRHR